MSKLALIKTNDSLIISYEGKTHTFHKTSQYYEDVLAAIRSGDHSNISNLIDLAKKVSAYSNGNFNYTEDGEIFVDGEQVHGCVATRIFEFMKEKLPHEPLLKFVRRLRNNPSNNSVNRLYACLEKNHHPILEDGRFLAYKAVRGDYLDKYSGTFDNSPGKWCEMPRNKVNDDPNALCSHGLHIASFAYAQGFQSKVGDRMVEVAVDPADIVSVPTDYNDQKMRVSKYEVIRDALGHEITAQYLELNRPKDTFQSEEEEDHWDCEEINDNECEQD